MVWSRSTVLTSSKCLSRVRYILEAEPRNRFQPSGIVNSVMASQQETSETVKGLSPNGDVVDSEPDLVIDFTAGQESEAIFDREIGRASCRERV